MTLRESSDRRTLLWVGFAAAVVALAFAKPGWAPYLCPVSCYFALACGVFAHNHNHCPTFTSKAANEAFGSVLSIFYGYPTFAWIPTHNMGHHKFVNRPGDETITWRYTRKHVAWAALIYFFVSSYWQSGPIQNFITNAKRSKPALFRTIVRQYVVWIGAHVVLLSGAIALHGLAIGFRVWALACLVPSFFALWTIMLFNYEQHVHADPWSEHNHSRSWEGKLLNYLLFNNGLHAAHHEHPGTHWSKLPAVHAALRPQIDPRLIEGGLTWYFVKQYALAPFLPAFGTVQVGRAAYDEKQTAELGIPSGA